MSGRFRLMALLLVFTLLQTGISVGQGPAEAMLQKTLQKFAQQNSLTDDQLKAMLGAYVLGSLAKRNDGQGVVDRETYVVLDEARNAVIVGGQKWEGLPRQETEFVLTDGRRILGSVPAGEMPDLRILIFTPKDVHFINPSANTGGIYRRFDK